VTSLFGPSTHPLQGRSVRRVDRSLLTDWERPPSRTSTTGSSERGAPEESSPPKWRVPFAPMGSRDDSVARPVIVFAVAGLLALGLVAASGIVVVRRLAADEALSEAQQLTAISARVVERRVNDGLLTGDAESLAAIASVVFPAVLHDPIVRVKIWAADGTILYSDKSRLIGSRYTLGDEELGTLKSGDVVAELSDLQAPENRYERSFGQLMEVYTRIETPGRTPLLFETYQRASSIAGSGRELAWTFAPVLVVSLVAFAILVVTLAWGLTRRVRRAQFERERLMQRATQSSDRERRRIAADLHDGPVQELAGLAMSLSAAAEGTNGASARAVLRDSASAVRGSVRALRSAIVGIYPPNLQRAGLPSALSDLVARLRSQGIDAELEVELGEGFGEQVDTLIYRVCQEALRNVEEHADAQHLRISVRRESDLAVVEVADDGRGIDPEELERARDEGHVGLEILHDLVRDAGGVLTTRPGDGGGTIVRVEVGIR
jgi:two-component system NarL family sensor kinase